MAGSNASEVIFISVNHSITLMGKVWLIVMLFLRVFILLFAGYPLYQDEQERFVCNTIQPGCANVCYDHFSPVSLFRFWLVQLITLCVPYFIFIIYVVHKVTNGITLDFVTEGQVKNFSLLKVLQGPMNKPNVKKTLPVAEQRTIQSFTGAYIFHLMFRTLLEAGFGAAHYYLFGFYIPRRFLCQHSPCTTQVDCYISRPTEKTVMLNFMLGVAALSLLLNVLDFMCAIKLSVKQKGRRKMLVERIYKEEQCFLSAAGGASRGVNPNAAQAQRDVEVDTAQPGSFRKRRGSKASSAEGVVTSGQEPLSTSSAGPPGSNTNGNNGYYLTQDEASEKNGSEVALYSPEVMGTPRSIRVSKRSRLKPPPPPRQDLGPSIGGALAPITDVSIKTCTGRVGPYTLVELGTGMETNVDGQEKRSEWV